jgi:hypothetical protein
MPSEIDFDIAELVIDRIATIAQSLSVQAGVGGMEMAGAIVSYLAEHPRDIEPCLRFGTTELPTDWLRLGCLSWHAQNGKIVRPEFARRAAVISKLKDQPHD